MAASPGPAEILFLLIYLGIMFLTVVLPIAYAVWLYLAIRNLRREIEELRMEVRDALAQLGGTKS